MYYKSNKLNKSIMSLKGNYKFFKNAIFTSHQMDPDTWLVFSSSQV